MQVRRRQEQHLESQRSNLEKIRKHSREHSLTLLESDLVASRDRSRDPMRFELKLPASEFLEPNSTLALASDSSLLSLIKAMLSAAAIELDTYSYVASLAGSGDMHWHQDVDYLWRETQVGHARHAPPPGLVALVPLTNMTSVSGPTEFQLGSQVNLVSEKWWAGQIESGRPPTRSVRIPASAGSVVLFDIRMGAGGGVGGSQPRPTPPPPTPSPCFSPDDVDHHLIPAPPCSRHPPPRHAQRRAPHPIRAVHGLRAAMVPRLRQLQGVPPHRRVAESAEPGSA